ncbi:MAG: sigma-54 dependent transcriptional regulator [Emergencia sp.]|nr:sigma-54 dependent transcriptional regulator [Emergencia sp.]
MKNLYKILIVDDEASYRETLTMLFASAGYETTSVSSGEEALNLLSKEYFPLVVSDIMMENMNGIEFLKALKNKYLDDMEIIMVTGYGSIETAVETMKMGAFGYFIKGHDPAELLMELEKASKMLDVNKVNKMMTARKEEYILDSRNPKMKQIWELLQKVAGTSANVLILGESGTGKEIIANQIHALSQRRDRPFVPINCQSYPDNLIESELFGHEKGAFTGAVERRIGKLEEGNGGTIFFDEIGEMSREGQIKLLRTLETRKIERIGSNRLIDVDVRIVSATHRNLYEMAQKGTFREDFLYRINTIEIVLPPLRERKEDLEDFIRYFVARFSKETGRVINGIEPETEKWLMEYDYPGNIRELKNIIERLVILADYDGILRRRMMAADHPLQTAEPELETEPMENYRQAKRDFDKRYILRALEQNQYNITKTASQIGLSRRQLFNKIKEHEIHIEEE